MAYNQFDISNESILKIDKNKDDSNLSLCALIQSNIQDEADATRKYFQLMSFLTNENDLDIIKEIISDELNHAKKLKEMVFRYSRIEEAKD